MGLRAAPGDHALLSSHLYAESTLYFVCSYQAPAVKLRNYLLVWLLPGPYSWWRNVASITIRGRS
jgi:hypothetical protein